MAAARIDATGVVVIAVAPLLAAWTLVVGAVPVADAVTAVVVPMMFALAGGLGGLWRAERFTRGALAAIGVAHLLALALSASALSASSAGLHVFSQLLFVGGFALFVPLAAGYPAGPAPRWSAALAAAALLVPLIAAVSGPTPTVLGSAGTDALGPIVQWLPPQLAAASAVVFLLPLVALVTAVVRYVRGDTELRGRLTLPLAALGGFALLVVAGALIPLEAEGVGTALFLVSAPLVPVGLIAGARALAAPGRAPATVAASSDVARLTPRERDVLELMAAGASNQAIARSLHISLSAVEKHTTAIFTKLELEAEPATHRRVAAVVAYLRAAG